MQRRSGVQTPLVLFMVVGLALLACKKKSSSSSATTESRPASPTLPSKPAAPALPPTPTKTFGLNDAAVLDGLTVTMEEFKECRLDNAYSRRSMSRKKEKLVGGLFVFEGNGEKEHSIYSSGFKVTDPEGLTYRSTFRSGTDCSPTLKSSRLSKGDKTKGWVLFQVPDKATGLKISVTHRRPYRPNTPADEKEQKVSFQP